MNYVFLSSPYSHDDPNVMEVRYHEACRATVWLAKGTNVVYSPIVSWHMVARTFSLPTDADFWKNQNETMLFWASKLIILAIDGWKTSNGVQQELRQAAFLGTRIWLMVPISDGEYFLHEYTKVPKLAARVQGSDEAF